jgi:hypothetical protein
VFVRYPTPVRSQQRIADRTNQRGPSPNNALLKDKAMALGAHCAGAFTKTPNCRSIKAVTDKGCSAPWI